MRDRSRKDASEASLLLLADSRLPSGGHAHSGGVEEAVRLGTITGLEDLARFLRGRLATAGLVSASLAAAACDLGTTLADAKGPFRTTPPHTTTPTTATPTTTPSNLGADLDEAGGMADGMNAVEDADGAGRLWLRLDAEADARTASPAQRETARTQGRLLIRTARRIWPSVIFDTLAVAVPDGAHHSVVLGAAAAAAGCKPRQAALAAAYGSVAGPATAAVRLLGLDPVTVHGLLADLTPELDGTARAACASLVSPHHSTGPHANTAPLPDTAPHAADLAAAAATGPTADPPGLDWRGGRSPDAGWPGLPGHAAPALDLLAEGHRHNPVRLFVS